MPDLVAHKIPLVTQIGEAFPRRYEGHWPSIQNSSLTVILAALKIAESHRFPVEIGNARFVATKRRRISELLLPRILRQIIPGFLYSLSDAVFGW